MKILKLYESNTFPAHYVIKKEDGSFACFMVSPFRKIIENDLTEIPFFTSGNNEAAEYLYRFYGLEKVEK